MTISIPTVEPVTLSVGDTWAWRREDLTDYPAPTWVLKYRFKCEAGGFEITAAASGTYHAVSVAAAVTALYAAGKYAWQARVINGATIYTVGNGLTELLPDLYAGAATLAVDRRSAARIMFDAVEAVMKKTATYEQRVMTWGDRTLERFSPVELLKLYDRLKTDVQREDAAAQMAATGINPRHYFVRLGRG